MSITIEQLGYSNTYKVVLNEEDDIFTTVTSRGDVVENWIDLIYRIHHRRLNRLLVGFDVKWRASFVQGQTNPVAVLQICVGRRCLLFQILHGRNNIPSALRDFFNKRTFRYCGGVGVHGDARRLARDYGIFIDYERILDIRKLVVERLEREDLARAGLKLLARNVMGFDVNMPRWVSKSRWDDYRLNLDQIKYASVDVFLFFEIARMMF